VANVVDLIRRKDHGGFNLPDAGCGRVYLSRHQDPAAALASAELDRTAHWWGLSCWILLTLLGGAYFSFRERRPRFRLDGMPVRWAMAVGISLLLWLLAVLLWLESAFALLWLGLWVLVGGLILESRKARQLWFPVGLVGIIALVLRIQAPHLPANWYVALQVPDGLPVADVVGSGGFAGLFRAIGFMLPINSYWVFIWNISASTLTAMLFSWAGYRSIDMDGERRWPSWAPAAWGLLLALSPILVRVGASDGTHVTALFAAAVAAACYVEATRSDLIRWWLGALFAAVLIGWTRLEFATFPLVLPFLFGTGKRPRNHRFAWVVGFIGLVGVAALASIARRNIHAEVTQIGTFQWSYEHITSWFKVLTLQFLREHHLNQALYLLFVPFAAWAIWTRRLSHLGPALAFYILVSPRVISAFHEPEIAWNLLIARYDLAIIVVMCLWAAVGLFGVWTLLQEAATRLSRQAPGKEKLASQAATVLLLALTIVLFAWGRPAEEIADHRYAFQHEYEFLSARLDELDSDTVIAIWQQGDRNERHDFDTALAQPHPLLVMDHPNVRWVVVNEFASLPEDLTDAYFFPSANAQLDPEALHQLGAHDAARSTLKLKHLRDQLVGRDRRPLVSETHRPEVLQFPLRSGELRLDWYRWDAPPLRAAPAFPPGGRRDF